MGKQMVQDAILMRLQEIGENLARVRRLDEDAFSRDSLESWHRLIGLRNVISHGYEEIDPEEIWKILTKELPNFHLTIQDALDNFHSPTD